jgi:hypothetical protein
MTGNDFPARRQRCCVAPYFRSITFIDLGGGFRLGAYPPGDPSVPALVPERVARLIRERRLAPRYEYALQTLREIPYGRWRQYDGEDALRFYALRLHEAGLIKSSPQQILA